MSVNFKKFLFLLALSISIESMAQDVAELEKLHQKLIDGRISDSVRILTYQDLAWEYRKTSPDSTILFSNKAIELISASGMPKGKSRSFNYIGLAYNYKGESVRAYEYYNKALTEATNNNNTIQKGHALNNLGRLYLNQGNFLDSYNSYFEAQKLFEKVNDQDGLSYTYKSLSELYQTQKDFNKALIMAQKSYDIRVETNNVRGQISALTEIASIYDLMGSFDLAFDHYLMAKKKAESIDDSISIANIDLGTSMLYLNDDLYSEALIYALKAINTASKTDNRDLIGQIELQLGKVYYGLGEEAKALDYFEHVVAEAEKNEELQILKDAYFYIYQIANQQNNTRRSLEAYLEYSDYNRAWNNAEAARKIAQLESRYEIDSWTKENAMLKAQNALDEAVISRQKIQTITLIGLVILVSVVTAIFSFLSRKRRIANTKLKEQYDEIIAQREEITRQNNFINEQNEMLQKRNSDLDMLNTEKDTLMNIVAHDLKSPLNKIKGISDLLKLSGLNPEQRDYNDLLTDIAQSGINLIRDLLDVSSFEGDARKIEETKVDVDSILLEKAKFFYSEAKNKNLEIVTQIKDEGAFILTDKVYLSRILDNLISNAIKFSYGGSKITIGAKQQGKEVEIFVKDEGPGLKTEDKKNLYKKFTRLSAQPTAGEGSNGLGLAIVKTLSDRLGARIDLESEIGKGSLFKLVFPVYQKNKEAILAS